MLYQNLLELRVRINLDEDTRIRITYAAYMQGYRYAKEECVHVYGH